LAYVSEGQQQQLHNGRRLLSGWKIGRDEPWLLECDGKMEKDTASVVAVIICGIAMARWSGGRRAQRVAAIAIACERGDRDRVWIAMAAIVCGCDRDDKMETKINCNACDRVLL
jgi:hypothetical protein